MLKIIGYAVFSAEYFFFHSFFGTKKMSEKKIDTFLLTPLPFQQENRGETEEEK